MKTAKKLFAVLLALAMALSLTVTAWAVSGSNETAATGSITITPKDNGEHNFTAYQIFSGELSASGVLSNIEWGSALNESAQTSFLNALKESNATFSSEAKKVQDYFKNCNTAASVAEALDKLIADAGETVAAEAVTSALKNVTFDDNSGKSLSKDSTSGKYTVTNLPVGYYLVKDSVTEGSTGAKASDAILGVVGSLNVEAKADIPEVKKEADGDSFGIGDEIKYTLTATVPDYSGSTDENSGTYKLEFTDTMSSALDLVYIYQANKGRPTGGITVKLGDTDVTSDFTISYNTDDSNHVLTVTCTDISKINGVSKDSVFTVTYTAKINSTYTEGAVDNKVTLVTKDYTSTDITEKVFPIKLQVLKVDGAAKDENSEYITKLPGAKFTLKNKDGKYLQVSDDGKVNGWVDESAASMLTTNENGEINVVGLAAGKYTLTETVAPNGYNLASEPFTLEINAEVNEAGDALKTLTISVNSGTALNGDTTNNVNTVTATIENNQGAQLPSTGGMGTTLFYIIGGALVLAAVVLLVTKKRMSADR